jgi:hypothetical protein
MSTRCVLASNSAGGRLTLYANDLTGTGTGTGTGGTSTTRVPYPQTNEQTNNTEPGGTRSSASKHIAFGPHALAGEAASTPCAEFASCVTSQATHVVSEGREFVCMVQASIEHKAVKRCTQACATNDKYFKRTPPQV